MQKPGKTWMLAGALGVIVAGVLCPACCRMVMPPPVRPLALPDGLGRCFISEPTSAAVPVTREAATRSVAKAKMLPPGLPVAELVGPAAEMGRQAGELLAPQIRSMIRLVGVNPQFSVSKAELALLAAGIAPEYLVELEAMAKAAGIERNRLVSANVALDTLCTVLACGADGKGPVRVARNMDFFPAGVLGPTTILVVRKPPGRHAFAAVSWAGYGGVITGMNDAGVTVAILQNRGSRKKARIGMPIAFRARQVLENAGTLAEAVACFQATPVASSHFLLITDAKDACVLWQDEVGMFHRRNADNGWLTWSNGRPDAADRQSDARAEKLAATIATAPESVTDAWLKEVITSVRLKTINAQVMLLKPDELSLELARARPGHAAGTQPWLRVELKRLLKGEEGQRDENRETSGTPGTSGTGNSSPASPRP